MKTLWSHNIQYHAFVLSHLPAVCPRGLDVGCGTGDLTRRLASSCVHITGIDSDSRVIRIAQSVEPQPHNIRFVTGDVMTYPFPQATLAVITVVAVLHHLPLQAALTRFRQLLAPEGVLLIVGLYRPATVADYGWCAFGRIASLAMRCFKRMAPLEATTRSPKETLVEIRNCAKACLPGVSLRRRLLFRYTLIWRKPLDPR